MKYLTGVKTPDVVPLLDDHVVGLLTTPATNYQVKSDWLWAADNGCFSPKTYKGDKHWFNWLADTAAKADGCLFATAPDVVGDAEATMKRSLPWLWRIRLLGLPAAFVAQDGLENMTVPWDEFDVLFIGGSTEWKLGPAPIQLAAEARRRGKQVHVGRVNSKKRWLHCEHQIKAHTTDGTFLAFGPKVNLPKLLSWFTPPAVAA